MLKIEVKEKSNEIYSYIDSNDYTLNEMLTILDIIINLLKDNYNLTMRDINNSLDSFRKSTSKEIRSNADKSVSKEVRRNENRR